MSSAPNPPSEEDPRIAESACGARIRVTPESPSVHYQGEKVYFCGEDCLQLFSEDPLNSCLASRLISGR